MLFKKPTERKPAADNKPAEPSRSILPHVKHVIAVASGKGGVGKSTVATNLTVALSASGAKVGLMDADVYGPSIPLMMGVNAKPTVNQAQMLCPPEKDGIKLMSMGMMAKEGQAVVWRGPMVHSLLLQFLTKVEWGELDYLIIDMPPGTGDAQLSICQTAPLSGAIIVTTPQEISLIDAVKGLQMFKNVQVPILGIIENMAGFVCSHCGHTTDIFLSGGGEKISTQYQVNFLGSIPLDPAIPQGGDHGNPIVLTHPESEASKRYHELAQKVKIELSDASLEKMTPLVPLHLEWKS